MKTLQFLSQKVLCIMASLYQLKLSITLLALYKTGYTWWLFCFTLHAQFIRVSSSFPILASFLGNFELSIWDICSVGRWIRNEQTERLRITFNDLHNPSASPFSQILALTQRKRDPYNLWFPFYLGISIWGAYRLGVPAYMPKYVEENSSIKSSIF